jgi:glycosyltransferase involved in cell wall biosynthesis
MKVRIGIDARRYSSRGRGQERYVRSLVHALASSDTEHELVVLTNPGTRLGDLGGRARSLSARRRLLMQHRTRLVGLRRLLVRDLDMVHFTLADGWYRRVTRSVVTIHDLSVLRHPGAYFADAAAEGRARRHHTAVAASADAVIAVSRATARDVTDLLHVPPERVAVVPHGVDPRFRPLTDTGPLEDPRRRYRLPPHYLLFVGGIDFKKNVARLIEAYVVARAVGRLPHALVLAGALQEKGNPFFDAAREQAAALRVERRVVWTGHVPENDLPALYAGADALVFPSLMEGFGLPVLEAMACGTPVVTSVDSAMEEVTGDEAVLVRPGDPYSIADGIIRALDPEVAGRLKRNGPLRAAPYTWDATAARTIEVYERVGADRPANAKVVT